MAERLEIIIAGKDQFSGAFNRLRDQLPSLKTLALSTGAAVAGMGTALYAMAKTTAAAYDKVAKFSDRIGISTESLSRFHVAADFSGIKIESFDTALESMIRRIGEASLGTGMATDALEKLAIPIDEIRRLEPDQQFYRLAQGLSAVENQGERASLAFDLFGRSGVEMLQMLKNGTAGLDAMTAEAEKFGLVISQKAANNAAEFNDMLTRLTGSITGIKNKLSEELLGIFAAAGNRVADYIAENRERVVRGLEDLAAKTYLIFKRITIGAAQFVDLISPLTSRIWQMLGAMWDSFRELPEWVQQAGIVGAVMGGKKGLILVGSMAHLLEVAKTSYEGFAQALAGTIKWGELATMNHQELKEKLQELREQGVIPLVEQLGKLGNLAYIQFKIDEGAGGATEKLRAIFDQYETMFSDLQSGEAARPKGIAPFTDEDLIKTVENMEASAEFMNEWREIDRQSWSEYWDWRVTKGREGVENDEEIKELLKENASKHFQDMQTISAAFGKKGFKLAKAISMAQAIIKAHEAFNVNMAAYAYPLGPIFGALALAAGLAQVATIASTSYGGAAHGGLTQVPREQTYLLDRGERVLSPSQNRDLTEFMADGAGGVTIGELSVNITAPASGLRDMDRTDWDVLIEENILPSIRRLKNWGITA